MMISNDDIAHSKERESKQTNSSYRGQEEEE